MKNQKIAMPVLDVRLVPIGKVRANEYNPNKVATPEMKLLRHSIKQDGYTQPIVTIYDKKQDLYIVIDGFHRYRCAVDYFHLEEVPVVVIDKKIQDRMASTIRHNRARGTHQIRGMAALVTGLVALGWDDARIQKELGMEIDEVLRLKQITGLKEAFANHDFSKSWEQFEARYYDDDEPGAGGPDPKAAQGNSPKESNSPEG